MEGDAGSPRDEELTEGLVEPREPWEELVEDPAAPREMLAVMFTDIVGSTELATVKGVEGRRRLYAVEPRERDNEADLPPLLRRRSPSRRSRCGVAAASSSPPLRRS